MTFIKLSFYILIILHLKYKFKYFFHCIQNNLITNYNSNFLKVKCLRYFQRAKYVFIYFYITGYVFLDFIYHYLYIILHTISLHENYICIICFSTTIIQTSYFI